MRNFAWMVGVLSILHVVASGSGAQTNLLYNGDFEMPAPRQLPPGWAIWGSSREPILENFARDATAPHGGQACLRISHPARSDGYIVTAPSNAVVAEAGKKYTLSFWARAEHAGRVEVGLLAYKDLKHYVDAPWPGTALIDVGLQWKSYTVSFSEGSDFFAEESRYLMTLFKAASHKNDQQTLWIDDVALTTSPAAGPRLINPATLAYSPVEHRLAPGNDLVIQVDARRKFHDLVPEVCGVSFHRIAGWTGVPYDARGKYTLPGELEAAIADLHLPMTRFYGLGVERFGLDGAIDRAAEFCKKIGVPVESTVLEFENQNANSVLSADDWVGGVRHSLAQGYGFRHWEITNEPYCAESGPLAHAPEAYCEHFLAVSDAVRRAHPQAKIGLNVENDPLHKRGGFCNYLLAAAAGHYDFVAAHHYCFMPLAKTSFEDAVLTDNFHTLDNVQRINALLRAYNPGRDVYQYDTEWGMMGHGAANEEPERCVRNSNIFGLVHRAVRLIYYTREQLLRGASAWEMFTVPNSPGYSFLSQAAPDKRAMNYWLYYYFQRHLGPTVLELNGTAPYHEGVADNRVFRGPITPAVATISADSRRLYIVVANGSWTQSVPCRIEWANFSSSKASGLKLSSADPDGSPFLERKEDLVSDLPVHVDGSRLTATLPPHSVSFITVETGK